MPYILDTDSFSYLFHQNPRIMTRMAAAPPGSIYTTIITEIEQLRGRHQQVLTATTPEQLLRAQLRLNEVKRQLSSFTILDIDDAAAQQFAKLLINPKLRKIGRADMLIAAIARSQGYTLVTRNVKHFRNVPGLKVEDWME
jgi:tRNA(fMet)-specific endonuclease VapC